MKYKDIIKTVNESILDQMKRTDYDVLSNKVFQRNGKIKIELIRFNSDFNPIVRITSLNDPNMTGYVQYTSKIEAIQAYNNLDTMEKVIEYMNNYQNEPDSLKWGVIIAKEGGEVKGGAPGMVSASTPGGMFNASPGGGAPSPMPGGTPELGTPTPGGAPGTPETPGAPVPEAAPMGGAPGAAPVAAEESGPAGMPAGMPPPPPPPA